MTVGTKTFNLQDQWKVSKSGQKIVQHPAQMCTNFRDSSALPSLTLMSDPSSRTHVTYTTVIRALKMLFKSGDKSYEPKYLFKLPDIMRIYRCVKLKITRQFR